MAPGILTLTAASIPRVVRKEGGGELYKAAKVINNLGINLLVVRGDFSERIEVKPMGNSLTGNNMGKLGL
jgi:hypothetical protein